MQKIDFVANIETIVQKLKSIEIVNLFNESFNIPETHYNYERINPLLFLSKSNFDQLRNDNRYSDILISPIRRRNANVF